MAQDPDFKALGDLQPTGETRFHLKLAETYREVPIYHLEYTSPTVFDRAAHQLELEAIAELPAPRFGLVINYLNLSIAGDYRANEQVELQKWPGMQIIRERAMAVARYNPGSLTSLIRTMAVHAYARRGIAAGFASDLDSALRHVRREIDQALDRKEALHPPAQKPAEAAPPAP